MDAGPYPYAYEVALSFAGEQRDYVRAVNEALKALRVKTFYDDDHAVDLWGKNHTEELPRIYAEDSYLVLMFISEHYVDKRWPRHERRAILTEMTQRGTPYLLPIRFDDSPVPGLDSAWHYLESSKFTPERLADAVYAQLVELGIKEPRPESALANGLTIDVQGLMNRVASDEESAQVESPILTQELADFLARPASSAPEDVRRAIDFGASKPVEIPVAQVIGLEGSTSPEGAATARVILQPKSVAHLGGKTVGLRLFAGDGTHLGTYAGAVTHAGLGRVGRALEFGFNQGLRIVLCVPFAEGRDGEITTQLALKGLDPEATRRSLGLLRALHRAATADVEVDGVVLGKVGGFLTDRDQEYHEAVQVVYEEADDLAFIQNETGVYFPMPSEFDGYQRLWMRAIRLMLEGHAAPIPRRAISAKAWPDLAPETMMDEGTMVIPMSGKNVSLAGHPIPLPPFVIYHPHVKITGIREAVEDAARGVENPREFVMAPVDDSSFVAYFPERLRDDAMESTPWRLTGIDDPDTTTLVRAETGAARVSPS